MWRKWQEWMVVVALVAVTSLVPPVLLNATTAPVRDACDTINIHWDCYEADGYPCPNHCPSSHPDCDDDT